jgi:hypothetical protein
MSSSRRGPSAAKARAQTTAASRKHRWAALFAILDTSGDSLIDKQEFLTAAASWTKSCPRIHSEDLDDFADWDSDGNGFLCEGEFICFCDALWQIIGEREFQALEAKAAELAKTKASEGQMPVRSAEEQSGAAEAIRPSQPWAPLVEQAATKLQKAMEDVALKDGRKVLRKCINEGRSAGVDRQLIDDAVALVRKVEVEEVLQRAMDSKNPKLIKVAIMNVTSSGGCEDKVSEAERLLGMLEASEGLKNAVASKVPDLVEFACTKAEEAGVDASEVSAARETLPYLRMRKQLDLAIAKKDAAELGKLILYMEEGGGLEPTMQEAMLTEARGALPSIKQQVDARKRLAKSAVAGNEKELMDAIRYAEDAKLPEDEIERVRKALRKEEARRVLEEAIESEKRTLLQKALEAAIQFDIEMPEIEIAQNLLKKLDASRDISLAVGRDEISAGQCMESLKVIVSEAKTKGVVDAKVMKAEELIAQTEKDGSI